MIPSNINRIPVFQIEKDCFKFNNFSVKGSEILYSDTFEIISVMNEQCFGILSALYDVRRINDKLNEIYHITVPLSNCDISTDEFNKRKEAGDIFIAQFGRLICYPYCIIDKEFLCLFLASSVRWIAN